MTGVQTCALPISLYPQLVKRFDLPVKQGAWLQGVKSGGPGDKAGLRGGGNEVRFQDRAFAEGGDIVTRIEDRPIRDADDLSEAVQLFDPGQKVTIELWRDGEKRKVELTLGDRPLSARQSAG